MMKSLLLACALVALAGCNHTEPTIAAPPDREWLVEITAWEWVAGQTEGEYRDRVTFFADPPEHEALQQLQSWSEEYGYNFATLRAEAWEWVKRVEHQGQ